MISSMRLMYAHGSMQLTAPLKLITLLYDPIRH